MGGGSLRRRVWGVGTVLLLVLASAATPTAAGAVELGLSDQHSAFFGDPLFGALNVATVRLVVPWDEGIRRDPFVDEWLATAAAHGKEPLIAFAHAVGDICPLKPCALPTPAEYREAFSAFRSEHPEVRLFTPWNEPNQPAQPTAPDPAAAAGFYNTVAEFCPGCTVVAGDMLDGPDLVPWLSKYRGALASTPATWGLHDYYDANSFQTTGVDTLLNTVSGEVWLTETGGIVRESRPGGPTGSTDDLNHAANSARYVLATATSRSRVSRAYFYGWQAGPETEAFDTALLSYAGAPRPAYDVLRESSGPSASVLVGGLRRAGAPELGFASSQHEHIRGVSVRLLAHGYLQIRFRCVGAPSCVGKVRVASAGWRAHTLAGRGLPTHTVLLSPRSSRYTVRFGARGTLSFPLPRQVLRITPRGAKLVLRITILEPQSVIILTRSV